MDYEVEHPVVVEASGKSERELLEELVALQKKTAGRQLVASVACVAIAAFVLVALLIVVPRLMKTADEVSAMSKSTEKLIQQAETSLAGIDDMIANVNKVVVDNTQSLTSAVDNLQNIDTDGLNEAIKNLSDAAEPLARLNNSVSGWFGR